MGVPSQHEHDDAASDQYALVDSPLKRHQRLRLLLQLWALKLHKNLKSADCGSVYSCTRGQKVILVQPNNSPCESQGTCDLRRIMII